MSPKVQLRLAVLTNILWFALTPCMLAGSETDLAAAQAQIDHAREELSGFAFPDADRRAWLTEQTGIMQEALDTVRSLIAGNPKLPEAFYALPLGDIAYMSRHVSDEIAALRSLDRDDGAPRPLLVTDFGARADGSDAGPGIRRALAALARQGHGTLHFPKGRYVIKSLSSTTEFPYPDLVAETPAQKERANRPLTHSAHIMLSGLRNVMITGDPDTEVIMGNPRTTGVFLLNCEDVTIRNLRIDYDPLPYWQGEIREVVRDRPLMRHGPATIEFSFDLDGFPRPSDPMFTDCDHPRARVHSSETVPGSLFPLLATVAPGGSGFSRIDYLSGNVFRGRVESAKEQWDAWKLSPGMQVVFFARMNVQHAIRCNQSKRCVLEDITIYSSPSMAFHMGGSESCIIRRCTVEARPGTRRRYSTAADMVYFSGSLYGHLIKDCAFKHNGDDFLNIHGKAFAASRRENENTLHFDIRSFPRTCLRPGLRLGLIRTSQGQGGIAATFTMTEFRLVSTPAGDALEVKVKEPLPDIVAPSRTAGKDGLPDLWVVVETLGHGFVVAGNRFAEGAARMIVGGRHGVIRDNHIVDALGTPSFMLLGNLHLYHTRSGEYSVPGFVTIRGNHLHSRRDKSMIQARSEPFGKPSRTQDIIGIEIAGNHFSRDCGGPSPFIKLDHVRHIVIQDNIFDNRGQPCYSPIYCRSGSGLDFGNNTLNTGKPNEPQSP